MFSIFEVFSQSPFGGWWLRSSLRHPRNWSFSSRTRTGWTRKATSKEWCPVSRTDRQPQIPPFRWSCLRFTNGCTWHCCPELNNPFTACKIIPFIHSFIHFAFLEKQFQTPALCLKLLGLSNSPSNDSLILQCHMSLETCLEEFYHGYRVRLQPCVPLETMF